jgi:ubiquinone/menaquinone biosynthesis C-methylase UbiE
MSQRINAQYNVASPDSLAMRIANKVRRRMFAMFMSEFKPSKNDRVLDIGVTSDQSYEASNYFEALYPHKSKIAAAGIDDASFLEDKYPGLQFVFADARDLPFGDGSFDYVHSSAVLEHVGSLGKQRRMIAECARVARKGIFITTPNRWFPVEFHTQLPLLHWLPKDWFRSVLRSMGHHELAQEENLNLMSASELAGAAEELQCWSIHILTAKLLGLHSNLILVGHRPPSPSDHGGGEIVVRSQNVGAATT